MVLSGLVFAKKIARMILIQKLVADLINHFGTLGLVGIKELDYDLTK